MFGDSLHAIRLLPALAYGGVVLLTSVITRELGGKRFAVVSRLHIGVAGPSDCQ
jgi:uncharacterized membrane protein